MGGIRRFRASGACVAPVRLACLWPVVALLALIPVYFAPMILPRPFSRPFIDAGDLTSQFYPLRYLVTKTWASGTVPLWNPYILGGHPCLADIQCAVFGPVTLLSSALTGVVGGFPLAMLQLQIALDLALASVLTYVWLHRVVRNTFASAIGAASFAFGGFLTSYPVQQLPVLETAVWAPLALLLIGIAVEGGGPRPRMLGLAGGVLGVAVLSGHPQTAMYLGLTAVIYYLFRCISRRVAHHSLTAGMVVMALSAVGVAAVQILPTLEFLPCSNRAAALSLDVAGHGYSMNSLPGVLLPEWMGEKALYIGGAAFILVVAAWLRPTGEVAFWTSIAAGSLTLALGKNAFLFPILYRFVPGFSLFQDQERAMVIFALAAAVLSAIGVRNVLGAIGSRRAALVVLTLPFIALAAVAAAACPRSVGASPDTGLLLGLARSAGFVVGMAAVLAMRFAGRLDAIKTCFPIGVLVIADLFSVNLGNNLTEINPLPSGDLLEAVASLQSHPEPFRIVADDDEVFPTNYAILAGVAHMRGDTPFALRRVRELLDRADNWRALQLFDVRFFVSRKKLGEGFDPVMHVNDRTIYFVRYSLPRLWVVRDFRVARNAEEALSLTVSPDIRPEETVVLERVPALQISRSEPMELHIREAKWGEQFCQARLGTTANGILVVSDVFYPGWKAYLDGREVPIMRANYAFRAVELPAGWHSFEMRYEPATFAVGLLLSMGTVVIVILLQFISPLSHKTWVRAVGKVVYEAILARLARLQQLHAL